MVIKCSDITGKFIGEHSVRVPAVSGEQATGKRLAEPQGYSGRGSKQKNPNALISGLSRLGKDERNFRIS
jgi:hypothetical protein